MARALDSAALALRADNAFKALKNAAQEFSGSNLVPWQAAVEDVKAALSFLQARRKALLELVGKVVPLTVGKKSINRARIIEVTENTIKIGNQYIINGEVKGEQGNFVYGPDRAADRRVRGSPFTHLPAPAKGTRASV